MALKELKGQGHWPTLLAAFLYFDFSFMVWTMMGPLATEIAESLKATQNFIMSADQSATLVAIPVLAGAILRVVLGFLVDRIGAKKTALISQFIVVCGLFYAYFKGETITYDELLFVAFILGFAGASFAVALPQAGQWYPPKLQGVVLGLAGAGNIGVVIDFIFAPKIFESKKVFFLVICRPKNKTQNKKIEKKNGRGPVNLRAASAHGFRKLVAHVFGKQNIFCCW